MSQIDLPSGDPATPGVELTAPAQPPLPAAPLGGDERVEIIDVVRGLALFGILAANMRGFAAPAKAYFDTLSFVSAPYDRLVQALIETFVQGKFITIFALLFGVGFSVQITRAEMRGARPGGLHVRRMAVLAAFGLAHGILIWWGDILFPYALAGLLLYLFRNCRTRTLVGWAIVLYLVPLALTYVGVGLIALLASAGESIPPPERATPAALVPIINAYTSGVWSDIQGARMSELLGKNLAFAPLMLPNVLGLFLVGMIAWRKRLFTPGPDQLPGYRRWMTWSLLIGLMASAAGVAVRVIFDVGNFDIRPLMLVPATLHMVGTPLVSLGYVLAIILLFQRASARAAMRRYGSVGRMALTNYLAHSVLGTLLFYGYGLGWYGRVGPALLLVPTLAIYALQAWVSPLWLARFRFGPAEWLWRSLAYRRRQPLRRREVPSVPAG